MSVQWDELEFLIKPTCKILVCGRKLDRAHMQGHTHTHARAWGFHTVSLLLTTQSFLLKGQNTDLILWMFPLNTPAQVLEASHVTHPPLHQNDHAYIVFPLLQAASCPQQTRAQTALGNYVLNSCRTWSVLYLSDFSLAQWMFYRDKRIPMLAPLACSWTFCGFVKAIEGFVHSQNHILGLYEGVGGCWSNLTFLSLSFGPVTSNIPIHWKTNKKTKKTPSIKSSSTPF